MNYEQEVRIEVRLDGILHNMCEGSVAQSIAFLKALEKEQKEQKNAKTKYLSSTLIE
jgi:hypothetical protein